MEMAPKPRAYGVDKYEAKLKLFSFDSYVLKRKPGDLANGSSSIVRVLFANVHSSKGAQKGSQLTADKIR